MSRSVLIVDDHEDFRASAQALLEVHGFNVVGSVGDGRSALTAVSELQPDLVLLDVQLPDMDGFEVAERLIAAATSARVILISSRDRRAYARRLAEMPGALFISKGDLFGPTLSTLL
jgi:DNA-binding NarL/FixJ family response regulator